MRDWGRGLAWVVPGTAVLTWAVGLVLGREVVRRWDLDPLTTQGVVMPIAVGVLSGLALLGVALLLRDRLLARSALVGVAAGGYSAWAGTTVLAMLNGTPYGYGSLTGDAGRMSAMVMHYSTTWSGSDVSDPSLPAEYPPLYPMLLGRLAAWTGRDGWKLLGTSQAVLVSVSLLAAFLLWRRLVPDVPALLAASTVTLGLSNPAKGNEILALAVLVPWILGTFAPPPGRRRMNAVLSGVLVGLMVPWYPSLLMLTLVGLAAVMVWAWWTSDDRRGYLLHALITVAVGFVVASWYIVPLVAAYVGDQKQVVADLFLSTSLSTSPFTVIADGPPWLYWLQLVGLVGTAALLRRAWWAPPFALLLAGIIALRALVLLKFVSDGHAFLLYYVPYVLRTLLLIAGVLVLVEVWHHAMSRTAVRLQLPTYLTGALVVAIALASTGSTAWWAWAPHPLAIKDAFGGKGDGTPVNLATLAHAERLPSGAAPRYAAPRLASRFPATQVVEQVEATLGREADPVVLSYDQRLFAFQPWASYLPPGRTSSSALIRWDDRLAAVKRLAATAPGDFAQAAAQTPFGPIDAFVLKAKEGSWYFLGVPFSPDQFASEHFTVTQGLPADTVVAVRR
ncbi:MAG TPA: hypothetical protein VFL94_01195 [Actinomycetales bacterium]|nr:hypothetical protein [Actinomycetales bacterium]